MLGDAPPLWELRAANETIETISGPLDLDVLLERTLVHLTKMFECHAAAIWMYRATLGVSAMRPGWRPRLCGICWPSPGARAERARCLRFRVWLSVGVLSLDAYELDVSNISVGFSFEPTPPPRLLLAHGGSYAREFLAAVFSAWGYDVTAVSTLRVAAKECV